MEGGCSQFVVWAIGWMVAGCPGEAAVKATRTTVDGGAEILAKRWDANDWSRGGAGQTADNTPIWLVEVQGEIPVLGVRGVKECEQPPSGANDLAFYIVTVDGK